MELSASWHQRVLPLWLGEQQKQAAQLFISESKRLKLASWSVGITVPSQWFYLFIYFRSSFFKAILPKWREHSGETCQYTGQSKGKFHLLLATIVKVAKKKERKHHVAQHEVSLLRVFVLWVVLTDLLCLLARTSCSSICKGICCIYIELWLIPLCLMGLFTRLIATVS